MSILSDGEIRRALRFHGLSIEPFDPARLQPASLDLTLHPHIIVNGIHPMNLTIAPTALRRGDVVLASTCERFVFPPTLAGRLEGKSTHARRFLFVHAAGFVDPGFRGQLTLEIVHQGPEPFELRAGMPICQIAFFRVAGEVERPYGTPVLRSHYQNQAGPTPARGDGEP